jgi:hypothetical protein
MPPENNELAIFVFLLQNEFVEMSRKIWQAKFARAKKKTFWNSAKISES